MKKRLLGTLLGTFFALLIAMPVVLKRVSERPASIGAAPQRDTVLARYGFCFQEVAKAAGIDFTHQAPTLDARLAHIMPQIAAMGAAVSIVDVDRDDSPFARVGVFLDLRLFDRPLLGRHRPSPVTAH